MSTALLNDDEVRTFQTVLSGHPLFSFFSTNTLTTLTRGCTVHTYQINETIVAEGEIIDAVYFIIKGKCEVRKRIASDRANEPIGQPVATLIEGENIGLSSVGLFSSTEERTATVVALSEVIALRLNIKTLAQALKEHPNASDLSRQLALLSRMHFIKSVAPFSCVANESLKRIAEQINEVTFPSGTTIFKQNDSGDACYIVVTGKVEISIHSGNGNSIILAELEANTIFGESALLMDIPRNATARVTGSASATLLKIDKPLFLEITQQQTNAQEALMQLQFKRCRPIKLAHIEVFTQKKADGVEVTILRDSTLGHYLQLSEQGLFLWNLLNGERSINEIVIQFYLKFHALNTADIASHITDLHNAGFVKLNVNEKVIANTDQKIPRWVSVISKIREVMEYKMAFGNADEWVTNAFHRVGWIFFTKPAIILCTLILILGFVSFVAHFEQAIHSLASSPYKWRLFYLQAFLVTLTIPLHELAHAFTTKFYGRKVYCFGVGWLWIGPFAFCDTSDMWLSPKKQRVMVDLAGVYLNAILAGIAGLCAMLTSANYPTATILLELFALSSYMIVIANLDTSLELDGYYALMDLLDEPNLRIAAIKWSVAFFSSKETINKSIWNNIKQNYKAVIYWLSSLVSIILIHIVIPYIVLTYLLVGLFGVSSPYLAVLFILIAVGASSLSIYKEIAYQVRRVDYGYA